MMKKHKKKHKKSPSPQALKSMKSADAPASMVSGECGGADEPTENAAESSVGGEEISPLESVAEPLTEERLKQMIEEAERRGYLRGRNEAVSLAMREPAMWENATHADYEEAPSTCSTPASQSDELFLRKIRPGVWD